MKHSLKKAISLHEKHMKEPQKVTESSQKKLMNLMKRHKKEDAKKK